MAKNLMKGNFMKKQIVIAGFYLFVMVLAGCVQPSLNPLFKEKQCVYEPGLVGLWQQSDSNNTWEFKKFEKCNDVNAYELTINIDGKRNTFFAFLGKIENDLFLDIGPADVNEQDNDLYKELMLSMHGFIKVRQIKPLELSVVDADKIQKIIEDEPNVINYTQQGDRIILTADTNDLRQFIIDYGKADDDANSIYDKTMKFVKINYINNN